jgi:ketosteroid isomerase-like protein
MAVNAAESKALGRQMIGDLFIDKNYDRFLDHVSDDCVWSLQGSTKFSGDFRGKDGWRTIMGFIDDLAELRWTVDNVIGDEDYAVVQSRGDGRTATGRDYKNSYCHVFHFSGGLLVGGWEYLDTAAILESFADVA